MTDLMKICGLEQTDKLYTLNSITICGHVIDFTHAPIMFAPNERLVIRFENPGTAVIAADWEEE